MYDFFFLLAVVNAVIGEAQASRTIKVSLLLLLLLLLLVVVVVVVVVVYISWV